MYYAGEIAKIMNINFSILESELRQLKNFEENSKSAEQGYNEEKRTLNITAPQNKIKYTMTGSEAFALGALSSGIDFYYSYPMTPATRLSVELSKIQGKHILIESESEIEAVNMAIGSAITGAKSMTGTSGGGFDLMTEGLSLAGKAGIPIILYLAQRHGTSTGVPTATGQGDLNVALHGGHGEFSRILIAPGDAKESIEKTTELFCLTQKHKVPGIILTDKHLVESLYSFSETPKITPSENSIKWPSRFTSYESDENETATENPEEIKKSAEKRIKKAEKLSEEIDNIESYKIYGNPRSKNIILSFGSVKGAILDAIKNLDVKFIHIIYIEPFSRKIKEELKNAEKVIVIENNSTSPFSEIITKKTGMIVHTKILKYNGQPFLSDELSTQIKEAIK
jgi:2-oxoglutarate ferredoxin oxidoreductase subunit alpha